MNDKNLHRARYKVTVEPLHSNLVLAMAVSVNVPTTARIETKSPHVSDSNIEPFLQPDFDPADYLNNILPSLSVSTTNRPAQNSQYVRSVQPPELSSQLQTLLSQLNAQTSRLSNALTQLTDEIIRSGGRLAYEVEVLRGETVGLKDSLDNRLRKDIEVFTTSSAKPVSLERTGVPVKDEQTEVNNESNEAETLERLRTLTSVRARLDSVIKVFGDAMQWPIAPSELSVASSLISVSAPDAGEDVRSREEKGKAYAEKLRNEINDMLDSGRDMSGLEAAAVRIEQLRQLTEVWKGTSEEKARLKLVESLQKPVEEKQKSLEKSSGSRKPAPSPARGMDYRYGNMDSSRSAGDGGYGFLQNLRNLKNDMYLE